MSGPPQEIRTGKTAESFIHPPQIAGSGSMDIAAWLHGLGLGEHAQAFRTHAIDGDILADLTEADLEKIGIPLGHRKKIVRAIAAFRDARPARPPAAAAREDGERRQMSVAFCDLVGSTALVSRLDPEDLRDVMGAYHRCVAETVARFGGCVGRYMDDGALLYFGYPAAHEDDAERAVRAGLELLAAVRALRPMPGVDLHARVGITTGLVVVGELLALAEVRERYAVGETMNLAARLQGVAEPDTVVIDQHTRQLLGDLFVYRDLGRVPLKGIAEPAQTWRVLRPSGVDSRFDALHAARLAPLVGRDDDLDVLRRRWRRARDGQGQVVLLQGEPGIGKSRIVAAFLEEIAGEPHRVWRYFCSPHHGNSALHPIIRQFERAAGFDWRDGRAAKLGKLDALLAAEAVAAEDRALLAELLLPRPGNGGHGEGPSPQQVRQRTLDALMRLMEGAARRHALVMVFEDAHWADPSSLELLHRAVERIHEIPALVVVTFRPEFAPSWIGQPQVTLLALNQLDAVQGTELVAQIAGKAALPRGLAGEIVSRASGVPLFIEELTRAFLEGAVASGTERAAAAADAIPATLNALLTARLDRLGPAKEVAQIGATLGREFSHELIAAVAECDERTLQGALDRLSEAGLVFRRSEPPGASYLFKHALVQEAAYGMLLRARRQQLHARTAEVLERQFDEIREAQPELLAHHFAEAGLAEKAAAYWGRAGRKSVSRSALAEAVAQFRMALAQLARLPTGAAKRRMQLELQVALAGTLVHIKGYAAPEVVAAFEEARRLAEEPAPADEPPDDPLLQFSILYGLWVARYVAIDTDLMCRSAAQFLARAEQQPLSAPRLIGHRLMGTSYVMRGEFQAARTHLDRAVALYRPAEHRPLAARFSQDIGVSALAFRSWTLWHLGYPGAAIRDADELLGAARALNQVATVAYGLFHAALPNILCGRLDAAGAQTGELLALVERHGLMFWTPLGRLLEGWLLALRGQGARAAEIVGEAFAAYDRTGSTVFAPLFHGVLAEALAQQGETAEAAAQVARALELARRTNERWFEAELHRIAGELQARRQDEAGAITSFRVSLAIAQNQQAKSYELRTAASLARLLLGQGKRCEAHELLAPVLAWFREGFPTRDLEAAQALLERSRPR